MPESDAAAPQSWQEEVADIARAASAKSAKADLGRDLRAHFDGLIAAGFSRAEALHLTGGYQSALVMAASQINRNRD